jgi:uncharacterized protein (TIGR02598 family)
MSRPAVFESGFSLVEVTLALGVAAICLMTVFAFLPVGLRTTQNANEQLASADILGAVAGDLRATPATISMSPRFAIPIPANPVDATTTTALFFDAEGEFSSALTADSRYQLTVTFLRNSGAHAATLVGLKITWPAAASPDNAAGFGEMFLALDRN